MVDLSKLNRIDEARHSKRQELDFVIRNRRSRLMGLWAGQRLGLGEKEAAGYAAELVGEAIVKPSDAHLVVILMRDFAQADVAVTEADLHAELERLHKVAAMEFGETGEKARDHPRAG